MKKESTNLFVPNVLMFLILTGMMGVVVAAFLCGRVQHEFHGWFAAIGAVLYFGATLNMAVFGEAMYAAGKQAGEDEMRSSVRADRENKPSWFARHHRYGYPSERL